MKKITLLAALVAIVFALVGPATVLTADPAGIESKSPEAIASIYVVDLVATVPPGLIPSGVSPGNPCVVRLTIPPVSVHIKGV